MEKFSKNAAVNSLIAEDGEEATKKFIGDEYGFDASKMSWKEIDDRAFAEQKKRNEAARKARSGMDKLT